MLFTSYLYDPRMSLCSVLLYLFLVFVKSECILPVELYKFIVFCILQATTNVTIKQPLNASSFIIHHFALCTTVPTFFIHCFVAIRCCVWNYVQWMNFLSVHIILIDQQLVKVSFAHLFMNILIIMNLIVYGEKKPSEILNRNDISHEQSAIW